ncbi:MAG: gamma-glutamyltransferase [Rhodospirillales bacterium]|nr:MAG: gamma-glutamyltransferase [Rhodospirillales bacterium]
MAAAEMLGRGGSAADAAVALYFVLAVTYPSAASLGGGGVCLVSDGNERAVYSLNFPAPRPAASGAATRLTAVPANVRGMAALHARYGAIDWRIVLAPAERIARLGKRLTRASARSIESGGAALLSDGETRRVFAPTGALPREGAHLIQKDLADTIAALRLKGADDMYLGDLADRMVAATRLAGGSLAHEDLRNFLPDWAPVRGLEFGNDLAYFAPPPAGAGLLAGQMWVMLTDRDRYGKADEDETLHLLVEASRRAWAGRERWLADDGTTVDLASLMSTDTARAALANYDPDRVSSVGTGPAPPSPTGGLQSTGFVVIDILGDAVACTVTSYRPFGTGIMAPGTGVLLAPAPGPEDRNSLSLGPMIVFNPRVAKFKFAAVGGPGPAAAAAMMTVAAESVIKTGRLDTALHRTRMLIGEGNTVRIEASATSPQQESLTRRGHVLETVRSLGQVNAVFCPAGYPSEESQMLCWAETDPRGFGLVSIPY